MGKLVKLSQHLTLDEDPKMSSKDYEPQQVILNLATSHSCSVKEHIWNTDYRPVTATEPTHDWEFKIEDPNRQDMRHYIDKIVINLHNTFPNPVRTFREPPFVVKESGYGNFEILVEIYFKGLSDKDAIRKISFNHNLFLTPTIQDVRNKKAGIKRENTFTMPRQFTLTHKDPSFIKRLLKGGGKKSQSGQVILKFKFNDFCHIQIWFKFKKILIFFLVKEFFVFVITSPRRSRIWKKFVIKK